MKKLIALTSIVALAATPAFAESNNSLPTGIELGLGLSASTGVNGFVGYANKNFESFWWKRLGARLDFASTTPIKKRINKELADAIHDVEIGDNGIHVNGATLESKHMAALVDFYPFGDTWFLGGWRLTGGYVFGNLKMTADLTGEIDGLPADKIAFKLGGEKYYYDGNSVHATADAKWKVRGPYAGTGFDIGIYGGFKIFLDAGVVFTSKAAEIGIDVPFTNLHKADGTPVNTPALQAQVEAAKADALKKAQDKLDEYKFFPMVKLGFMYRF